LSGEAGVFVTKSSHTYAGTGSLFGTGLVVNNSVTGIYPPSGRLRLRGYATFSFTKNKVPIPVTPYNLGGTPLSTPPMPKLIRAYGREAAINGWWDEANSAFIPAGTATTYKVLPRQQAPPGTEPHFGLIISEGDP